MALSPSEHAETSATGTITKITNNYYTVNTANSVISTINGVSTMGIEISCSTPYTADWLSIADITPIPRNGIISAFACSNDTSTTGSAALSVRVASNGKLQAYAGVAGKTYRGTIAYINKS